MLDYRWRVLILSAAAVMVTACVFPMFGPVLSTPDRGTLDITLDYTGTWYRDTFDYARDAANIRHVVLVVPEDEAVGPASGVFVSLDIQADALVLKEDRQEYAWALEYLYEAPQGFFTGEFEPGTYLVAAAFIAGPLAAEEAGAGPDAILWPGITGGGASTDYQVVMIEADETATITIPITDRDGWACPWLYVYNGQTFERRTEILRNVRDQPHTEITPLGTVTVTDGVVMIRIAEEKDEVTVIDRLFLLVDGVPVRAEADPAVTAQVAAADGDCLLLRQGESVEFRFAVPPSFAGDGAVLSVTGYYVPGDSLTPPDKSAN